MLKMGIERELERVAKHQRPQSSNPQSQIIHNLLYPEISDSSKESFSIGNSLQNYNIISELGRGSYGVVYKVKSKLNNQEYVIKKINLKHMKIKHQKEAIQEVQILKKVNHENIIRYYASFYEEDALFIVMEYANGGDLQTFIKKQKEQQKYLSEKEIWKIIKQLCSAVSYLHDNNIIHRDIKTLNVFMNKNKSIKLGDLGVSKIVQRAGAMNATKVGTPLYLAPELVKQNPYDYKVDVWALGCVFYHICCLDTPFKGDNLIALGFNIIHKFPKPIPSQYSAKLNQFIMKLLEKTPQNRPKLNDLQLQIPLFDEEQQKNQLQELIKSSSITKIVSPKTDNKSSKKRNINKNNDDDQQHNNNFQQQIQQKYDNKANIEFKEAPPIQDLSFNYPKNNDNDKEIVKKSDQFIKQKQRPQTAKIQQQPLKSNSKSSNDILSGAQWNKIDNQSKMNIEQALIQNFQKQNQNKDTKQFNDEKQNHNQLNMILQNKHQNIFFSPKGQTNLTPKQTFIQNAIIRSPKNKYAETGLLKNLKKLQNPFQKCKNEQSPAKGTENNVQIKTENQIEVYQTDDQGTIQSKKQPEKDLLNEFHLEQKEIKVEQKETKQQQNEVKQQQNEISNAIPEQNENAAEQKQNQQQQFKTQIIIKNLRPRSANPMNTQLENKKSNNIENLLTKPNFRKTFFTQCYQKQNKQQFIKIQNKIYYSPPLFNQNIQQFKKIQEQLKQDYDIKQKQQETIPKVQNNQQPIEKFHTSPIQNKEIDINFQMFAKPNLMQLEKSFSKFNNNKNLNNNKYYKSMTEINSSQNHKSSESTRLPTKTKAITSNNSTLFAICKLSTNYRYNKQEIHQNYQKKQYQEDSINNGKQSVHIIKEEPLDKNAIFLIQSMNSNKFTEQYQFLTEEKLEQFQKNNYSAKKIQRPMSSMYNEEIHSKKCIKRQFTIKDLED